MDQETGLTFKQLHAASFARMTHFKDRYGDPIHPPSGEGFDWFNALVGEVGEYAGWKKKYDRGDIDYTTFLEEAGKELADIQCYLAILAGVLGIDLGQTTIGKFNEVSGRVHSDVRL